MLYFSRRGNDLGVLREMPGSDKQCRTLMASFSVLETRAPEQKTFQT